MKIFLFLGKLVTLAFWGIVIGNLYQPFAQPFDLLLRLAGGVILAVHVLEIFIFHKRLKDLPMPFMQRVQVLVFGVFHVLGLPAHKAESIAAPVGKGAEPEQIKGEEAEHAENLGADAVVQPVGTGSGGN